MKIYKITEASEYLGVSINTLKTLANNGKINSFKTTGSLRRLKIRIARVPIPFLLPRVGQCGAGWSSVECQTCMRLRGVSGKRDSSSVVRGMPVA